MADFRIISSGKLTTNAVPTNTWSGLDADAADMYSGWVRCNGNDGFVGFHFKVSNTDYVGTIRIQAHNDPADANLDAVNVELSDGSTGVAVASGVDSSGFIHVSKNKANYFRMFLDYTSGSATGNEISATVHQ